MDPMTLAALLSGLGSLGGMFFKDNGSERLLKLLRQYTNPTALSNNADAFYKNWLTGPAFTGAQRDILGATRGIESTAAQSLSNRGLTTSGIGSIIGAVAPNVGGFQMANLKAGGRQAAMEQALRAAQLMIGGASGMPAPRNVGADIYGGGLDALSKALTLMAKNRQAPQVGNWNGRGATPYGGNAADYFETLNQMPWR